jgi:hypothetical protein
MSKHYVYIIGSKPNGPVKVGFSTNHKQRLGYLQTGFHLKLHLIKSWNLTYENAKFLERAAHKELISKKLQGEWFNCTPDYAIALIANIIIKTKKCRDWSAYKPAINTMPWAYSAGRKGGQMSGATKKAATAAKLKLIEQDLKENVYSTRELLDRVGIKSVNSIKNHYGINRETMQARYRAELKRKERRNAKN